MFIVGKSFFSKTLSKFNIKTIAPLCLLHIPWTMLAVWPLGPQYCWLFAWYELGRQAHLVLLLVEDTPPKLLHPHSSCKWPIGIRSSWTCSICPGGSIVCKLSSITETYCWVFTLQFVCFRGCVTSIKLLINVKSIHANIILFTSLNSSPSYFISISTLVQSIAYSPHVSAAPITNITAT